METFCKLATLTVALSILLPSPLLSYDWFGWGGPHGDFTLHTTGLIQQWQDDQGPKIIWKRPLGEGYSTILAKDGRLYTFYSKENKEVIAALEAATGDTVWESEFPQEIWEDMRTAFGLGPNASMLIVQDRIIAVGISGQMRCLRLKTGKLIWQRDLPEEYGRYQRVEEYGYSASPISYGDRVIVQVGGATVSVIAVNPQDGSTVWTCGPGGISYAQASVHTLAGVEQLVFFTPQGVNGLNLATGDLLWHHTIPISNGNHLTPVVQCDDNHLYVASQFREGGGRLLKILREKSGLKAQEIWFDSALSASCWTLIRRGDVIYGSSGGHNNSPYTAFEWRTGKVLWKERGFRMAQSLLANTTMIILDEKGYLSLAEVSESGIKIEAKAKVAEQVSWTVPTLVASTLYIRDRKNILAIDLGVEH